VTAAIVLAAGPSTRLGRPKQLVTIDGESMLARSIRVAFESGVDAVFVVLGAHAAELQPQLADTRATPILNPDWQHGMSSSLHAGLTAALANAPTLDSVLLLTCDQPAVTGFHLLRLHLLAEESPARIAASTYAGTVGVPAVFPRACFDELLALTGDSGARSVLAAHAIDVATLPLEHGELDLDTPESLAAAHRIWPA